MQHIDIAFDEIQKRHGEAASCIYSYAKLNDQDKFLGLVKEIIKKGKVRIGANKDDTMLFILRNLKQVGYELGEQRFKLLGTEILVELVQTKSEENICFVASSDNLLDVCNGIIIMGM